MPVLRERDSRGCGALSSLRGGVAFSGEGLSGGSAQAFCNLVRAAGDSLRGHGRLAAEIRISGVIRATAIHPVTLSPSSHYEPACGWWFVDFQMKFMWLCTCTRVLIYPFPMRLNTQS